MEKNTIWETLSDEKRSEIIETYNHKTPGASFNNGYRYALETFFGKDNLKKESLEKVYDNVDGIGVLSGTEIRKQGHYKFGEDEYVYYDGLEPVKVVERATIIGIDRYVIEFSDGHRREVNESDLSKIGVTTPADFDLRDYLKGHEQEMFWSPAFGDIRFKHIIDDVLVFEKATPSADIIHLRTDGRYSGNGVCVVFPNKEAYSTLRVISTIWKDWDSKQFKHWRADAGLSYWTINLESMQVEMHNDERNEIDNKFWTNRNYFQTIEEAQEKLDKISELLTEK